MKFKRSLRRDEKGVALLELGIVLPLFLIFLIIGVIEVGSMLINFQEVTSIVREGVRLGGKLEGLEPGYTNFRAATGSTVQSSSFTSPGGASVGAIPTNQEAVRRRIMQLLYLAGFEPLESEIVFDADYYQEGSCAAYIGGIPQNTAGGCPPDTEGTLSVTVSVAYNGLIFPLMDWVRIRVTRRGPYLFAT